MHDIGKNLVRMMLKGIGIEVYDMGVDVSPEAFADKAEEVGAQVVCLSALLTTTMPSMKAVIDEFTKRGIRDKYIFMIGGAPITANYKTWANNAEVTAEAYIKAAEQFGLDVIVTLTDLSVEAVDFRQKLIYPENEAAHPDF